MCFNILKVLIFIDSVKGNIRGHSMKQHVTAKKEKCDLFKSKHPHLSKDQKKHPRKKHLKIKVLVTIPEKLYQNGIISLLKGSKDVTIRETESSWLGTLMIAEKFKPHVVIMSLEAPPAIRSIFLSVIRKNLPDTKILLPLNGIMRILSL